MTTNQREELLIAATYLRVALDAINKAEDHILNLISVLPLATRLGWQEARADVNTMLYIVGGILDAEQDITDGKRARP